MKAYPGMKFNRDLSNFSLTRLAAARLASNPAAKQIKTVTANATISRANPPSEDSIPKIGERALAKVFKPPISLPKTTATITAGMRKTNPPMTVVLMKSSWRFIALSPFVFRQELGHVEASQRSFDCLVLAGVSAETYRVGPRSVVVL